MQQQLDIVTSGGVSIPPPDNQTGLQQQLRDIHLTQQQQQIKSKKHYARATIWDEGLKRKFHIDRLYKSVLSASHQSLGRRVMLEYLTGTPITKTEAIAAKCADCCCYYVDGENSCESLACPLFPWMKYNNHKKGWRKCVNNGRKKQ